MKTATVSDFRTNMKKHLNDIERDQDILVLTGPKKKDFVLITLEQFNSMEETAHLLSTPVNAARLAESVSQHKAGDIAHSFKLNSSTTRSSKVPRLKNARVTKRKS